MNAPLHKFEVAGLGKAPFRCWGMIEKKYQACHGAPVQPAGSCQYCGTGIMYCYLIESADRENFIVGSECVHKTGDAGLILQAKRVKSEAKAAKKVSRKAVEKAAKEAEIAAKVVEFLAANEGLAAALELKDAILEDFAARLKKWGTLSERQVAFALKLANRIQNPEIKVPVVAGRRQLRGTVLTTRYQDSQFGAVLKMLVKTDSGEKIWGSVPSAIITNDEVKGKEVEFTATVEISEKDPCFGFFKRPSKARLLTQS